MEGINSYLVPKILKNNYLESSFAQILLGSMSQNMSSFKLRVDYLHLSILFSKSLCTLEVEIIYFCLNVQINLN